MKKLVVIFLIYTISIEAMKQKTDMFYRQKIQKAKTTTPSYCPCKSHHYMMYNSPEIIYLLYSLHLPKMRESKESIKLGELIDTYATQQVLNNDHYKEKVEALIKKLCAQVRTT